MEKAIERAQMLVNHLLPEQHTEVEKKYGKFNFKSNFCSWKKKIPMM